MSFLFGTVSFSRFRVVGGSPKRLDDRLLDKLRAAAVGSKGVVRTQQDETGWSGGRHLLDGHFDEAKNIILDCLHFAMRIDGHRVPPDLLRAYFEMEMDALRDKKANGHTSAKLKKQAMDAARDRAAREVKEGRFRRLRLVPILWDTRNDALFVGSSVSAVLERLHPLFRETFDRRLEPMTAGAIGYDWAERRGLSRQMESMRPARLVEHPGGNGHIEVYWTARDAASRDFLGNEFLLWLWYTLAEVSDTIELADKSDAAVVIVKQLTLECPWAEFGKEVITCEGPTQLPESRRAIAGGKLPRKCGLIVSRQNEQYEFSLQAEGLHVLSAALPKAAGNGNGNGDGQARNDERVEQIRHLAATADLLYEAFLEKRLSSDWPKLAERMSAWLGKA